MIRDYASINQILNHFPSSNQNNHFPSSNMENKKNSFVDKPKPHFNSIPKLIFNF